MKTIEEIKTILSDIEAGEFMYRKLNDDDVPNLKELMNDAEPWMAARVIFALSRLGGAEAHSIIEQAVTDERKEVRIAVAASSKVLPVTMSDSILESLIDDADPGVKKYAIKSIDIGSHSRVKSKLQMLSVEGANETLRNMATDRLFTIHNN